MPFPHAFRSILLPTLLLITGIGCSAGTMKKFDVVVTLVDDAAKSRVHVDLVGANPGEVARLRSVKMSTYILDQGKGHVPPDRTRSFNLAAGTTTQTLSRNDPIWKKWEDAKVLYLFVLADYPRATEDHDGDGDPRRLIIPLDAARWKGSTKQLEIRIQPTGLICVPPPNPES